MVTTNTPSMKAICFKEAFSVEEQGLRQSLVLLIRNGTQLFATEQLLPQTTHCSVTRNSTLIASSGVKESLSQTYDSPH